MVAGPPGPNLGREPRPAQRKVPGQLGDVSDHDSAQKCVQCQHLVFRPRSAWSARKRPAERPLLASASAHVIGVHGATCGLTATGIAPMAPRQACQLNNNKAAPWWNHRRTASCEIEDHAQSTVSDTARSTRRWNRIPHRPPSNAPISAARAATRMPQPAATPSAPLRNAGRSKPGTAP